MDSIHDQLDQAIGAFDFDKALSLLSLFDLSGRVLNKVDQLSLRRLFRSAVTHNQFKILEELYKVYTFFVPTFNYLYKDISDMKTNFTLVVLNGQLEMLKCLIEKFKYDHTLLDDVVEIKDYYKTKESAECFKYLLCSVEKDEISLNKEYIKMRNIIDYSPFFDDPWWREHYTILEHLNEETEVRQFDLYLQQVNFQKIMIKIILEDKLLKDILEHIVCPYL
jgi:hypothetical protein